MKVNLGSGLVVAEGWINVEGSLHAWAGRMPGPLLRMAYRSSGSSTGLDVETYATIVRSNRFVPHDLRNGIPLDDSSVDFVFAARVLETLYIDQTARLLREAARVLKPGGYIRVCVNDLQARIIRYQEGDRQGVIRSLFGTSDSTFLNSHRSTYDFDLLHDLLSAAGFEDTRRCSFREGKVPDLQVLEHRPEEALFVEALRP